MKKHIKYMYVNCCGWLNMANGGKIFEFFFDEEGNLMSSTKNIKSNYSGMDIFKKILNSFSVKSLQGFCSSSLAISSQFSISETILRIEDKEYKVLGSFGTKSMSDTGCSLHYCLEFYE